MMRFILVFVLMAVAAWGASFLLPWWSLLPIAFVLTLLFPMKTGRAFLAAGLGVMLCYALLTVNTDMANEHILSSKMAILFKMPSYVFMLVFTAFIGFITAGIGAWLAIALRGLFLNKNITVEEV